MKALVGHGNDPMKMFMDFAVELMLEEGIKQSLMCGIKKSRKEHQSDPDKMFMDGYIFGFALALRLISMGVIDLQIFKKG